MGIVVDIIYCEGSHPSHGDSSKRLPSWIVVDFPQYKGPACFEGEGHRTWVPIGFMTLNCERNCCYRQGFPLVVQKAKTIHLFQGLTVGEGDSIRRIVVHLDLKLEKKMPNVTYTGCSRTKLCEDMAIEAEHFDFETLKMVGNTKVNEEQRREIERLRGIAESTKRKYMAYAKSDEYKKLSLWFIGEARPEIGTDQQNEINKILDDIEHSLAQLTD